jgi:hypothetical protein
LDLEKHALDGGTGPRVLGEIHDIVEAGAGHSETQKEDMKDTDPPNLTLNLIPDTGCRELPAAAFLGISLQLLVLIIAGLTTFYPNWEGKFSVQLYEFYCMAGGTILLTFGLIICASVVNRRTENKTYETKS